MKRLITVSAVLVAFMFFLLGSTVKAQDFCQGNFDYDKDVDGTDASTFKQDFGRSSFSNPCPPDGPAPVERTWQSESYADGDDGYYHMGVRWDFRFTDNGNGTVTDNLTGLIWLKNACCCLEELTWIGALAACNGLANGFCGLADGSVAGDWRMPNVKEMASLIDYDYVNPAMYQSSFFNNVQSDVYWSSTTDAYYTDIAWVVSLYNGRVFNDDKTYYNYVWPVKGGHPY